MNGDFLPLKEAYAAYLGRWYSGIYPDTPAVAEFASRGLARSIVWAPDRMVDKAEDMLKAYQKNSNQVDDDPVQHGKNAIFPVVIVAMSKDYMPASPDMGGRQIGRRMIQLEEGGSVYGYRQAMGEIRTQVVIMAPESATARSLASQFSLWIGEIPNRRFYVTHKWGQYTVTMPCMIELPDIMFSNIEGESAASMSILAADVTLKTVTPYFDAPGADDPNDGSSNNPPGYPTVAEVHSLNEVSGVQAVVTADETVWNP